MSDPEDVAKMLQRVTAGELVKYRKWVRALYSISVTTLTIHPGVPSRRGQR